jgi:ribosomal protein S18 acetylase RimI-like enzyme
MIKIVTRGLSSIELERVHAGFDQNAIDQHVEVQSSDRFGTVALDGDHFVGAASGLAYKNNTTYNGWFYLTDLFVEKPYRRRGIGAELLTALEHALRAHGVRNVWTWTAEYEAPTFYKKLGYAVFAVLENYYSNGETRIGMRKVITMEGNQDADS